MTHAEVPVAEAPDAAAEAALRPRTPPGELLDAWGIAVREMAVLLRGDEPGADWPQRFDAAVQRLRALAARDLDIALYGLIHHASVELDRYSAHHAMLCAVICDACSTALGFDAARADALLRAALTMNLSMAALQDGLARQLGAVTVAQRQAIAAHAERSVAMLGAAGVADALWLDTVRHHHGGAAEGSTAAELAELLQRVDVYTAKLSRRASRAAVSPALAARDVCFGRSGTPDRIGATILRCLGLYPPGCFVMLANGDLGIVVRRGAKAHTPIVAALRRGDEGLYSQPLRRDSADARFAVKHGVAPEAVKVRLNHERVLAAA